MPRASARTTGERARPVSTCMRTLPCGRAMHANLCAAAALTILCAAPLPCAPHRLGNQFGDYAMLFMMAAAANRTLFFDWTGEDGA